MSSDDTIMKKSRERTAGVGMATESGAVIPPERADDQRLYPTAPRPPSYRHPEPDPAEVQAWLAEHADDDPATRLSPTEDADTSEVVRALDENVTGP